MPPHDTDPIVLADPLATLRELNKCPPYKDGDTEVSLVRGWPIAVQPGPQLDILAPEITLSQEALGKPHSQRLGMVRMRCGHLLVPTCSVSDTRVLKLTGTRIP